MILKISQIHYESYFDNYFCNKFFPSGVDGKWGFVSVACPAQRDVLRGEIFFWGGDGLCALCASVVRF